MSRLECRRYQFPLPCHQELLLTPALLEQLTCAPGSGELGRILTMPEGHQVDLQGYRDAVCSGSAMARAQRFSDLATELRNQLDMAKIAQQVRSCLPAGQQTCRLAWRSSGATWSLRVGGSCSQAMVWLVIEYSILSSIVLALARTS